MGRFEGKVAAVTGGASGLGRATALAFARGGASVAVFDIDTTRGPEIERELRLLSPQAMFVCCDVTDERQVDVAFREVTRIHGRIDILHVNSGIIDEARSIPELDYSDWRRIIGVNLDGAFLTAKHGIRQMRAQGGGVIVFTGSTWAHVCEPGFASYSASKGAVVSLARALALDHAKDNIRINVVCPGAIRTPLLEDQLGSTVDHDTALQRMGRISTPEEIANVVAFLASDDAAAIRGATMMVDQGETLGYGPGLHTAPAA